MEQKNLSQLNEAIATLTRAVESVERRSGYTSDELASLVRIRSQYLSSQVEAALPALNRTVLERLRGQFPAFVTRTVEEAFKVNAKIFLFFERKGYQQALTLMKVQLSSHLVLRKFGKLPILDQDIDRLRTDQSTLFLRGQELIELIKLLQKAADRNVVLPPVAAQAVEQIANVRNAWRERRSTSVNSSNRAYSQPAGVHTSASSNDSDFDVFLYMVTDIPTSTRTLIMDALVPHRRHDSEAGKTSLAPNSGNGDSVVHQSGEVQNDGASGTGRIHSTHQVDSSAAGLVVGAAAVIATDDSLGSFS